MGSLQTMGMAKGTHKPLSMLQEAWHVTTKMGSQNLVLITHFAAKIMLRAFLNQGCERWSAGFECHLTAYVAECIQWIYALSWHINGGTNTMYFCDDNELWPATGRELSHMYDTWLFACYMSRLPPTGPQWLTCRLVLSHSLMQHERCGW